MVSEQLTAAVASGSRKAASSQKPAGGLTYSQVLCQGPVGFLEVVSYFFYVPALPSVQPGPLGEGLVTHRARSVARRCGHHAHLVSDDALACKVSRALKERLLAAADVASRLVWASQVVIPLRLGGWL